MSDVAARMSIERERDVRAVPVVLVPDEAEAVAHGALDEAEGPVRDELPGAGPLGAVRVASRRGSRDRRRGARGSGGTRASAARARSRACARRVARMPTASRAGRCGSGRRPRERPRAPHVEEDVGRARAGRRIEHAEERVDEVLRDDGSPVGPAPLGLELERPREAVVGERERARRSGKRARASSDPGRRGPRTARGRRGLPASRSRARGRAIRARCRSRARSRRAGARVTRRERRDGENERGDERLPRPAGGPVPRHGRAGSSRALP